MKKDRPRYAGRVEYLAVREQVKGLFEKGYSLAMLFRELSGAGKISMSYEQFTKYASGRVCNVQSIYNNPPKATKKKRKTPVSDSPQEESTSAIAISEQERANQTVMENVSPNIVKFDQKRFSGEIEDSQVL